MCGRSWKKAKKDISVTLVVVTQYQEIKAQG
ncbi:hypothetical protein EVA_09084, partial [gut metagenome]